MEQLNQKHLKSRGLESSTVSWKSKTGTESTNGYKSRSYEWLFDSTVRVNTLNKSINNEMDKVIKAKQRSIRKRLSHWSVPSRTLRPKSQRSPLNDFLRKVIACQNQRAE